MNIKAFLMLIVFLMIGSSTALHSQTIYKIRVAANTIITKQYKNWVGNDQPWQITDFSLKDSHRGMIELILLSKALKIAGIDHQISISEVPNYSRALIQAKNGKVDLPVETIWKDEIDQADFYITDPIFRKGEIELGIYVLPSNKAILKVTSLKDLQQFSAVSSSNWLMNWGTLREMGITRYSAPRIDLMYKMVKNRRVDFYLTSFTTEEDFSSQQAGVRLIPVPNIKIGLNSSRHFAVSKVSPNGKIIYESLQEGLKVLRKQGVIRKAFEKSGYLDTRVKKWKRIYP